MKSFCIGIVVVFVFICGYGEARNGSYDKAMLFVTILLLLRYIHIQQMLIDMIGYHIKEIKKAVDKIN